LLYKIASKTFAWFPTKKFKKFFFSQKIYFPVNFAEVLLLGTQNWLAVVIKEMSPNNNN
jgi:hypothetical protein